MGKKAEKPYFGGRFRQLKIRKSEDSKQSSSSNFALYGSDEPAPKRQKNRSYSEENSHPHHESRRPYTSRQNEQKHHSPHSDYSNSHSKTEHQSRKHHRSNEHYSQEDKHYEKNNTYPSKSEHSHHKTRSSNNNYSTHSTESHENYNTSSYSRRRLGDDSKQPPPHRTKKYENDTTSTPSQNTQQETPKQKQYSGPKVPPPEGWLDVSKFGSPVEFFIPCRTFLSDHFAVKQSQRHTAEDFISHFEKEGKKIGLIISLTNTNRYYDPNRDIPSTVKYVPILVNGFGCYPQEKEVVQFCNIVQEFREKNPDSYIAVHCTHGCNRTGFFICYYLCNYLNYKVDEAVQLFSKQREPGLYKASYIVGLCVFRKEWESELLTKIKDGTLNLPLPKHASKQKMAKHTKEALERAERVKNIALENRQSNLI